MVFLWVGLTKGCVLKERSQALSAWESHDEGIARNQGWFNDVLVIRTPAPSL